MKLILARHGSTIEQEKGLMHGHMPGRLSMLGMEQADILATKLKDTKIDAIYSSDLARAENTTKSIAKYHNGIPVVYTKSLREADLGSYTGKPDGTVDWNNRPAEIESMDSMKERASDIIEEAFEKYPKGTVLFMGHSGINMAITSLLLKKEPREVSVPGNGDFLVYNVGEEQETL